MRRFPPADNPRQNDEDEWDRAWRFLLRGYREEATRAWKIAAYQDHQRMRRAEVRAQSIWRPGEGPA